MNQLKNLQVDPKTLGLKPIGTQHQYQEINYFLLEKILIRCGKYLKKIDVSSITSECCLSLVAQYCLNIQSISCHHASEKGILDLSNKCKNITAFTLINNIDVGTKFALGHLLFRIRNNKLQVLEFKGLAVIDSCFWTLTEDELVTLRMK